MKRIKLPRPIMDSFESRWNARFAVALKDRKLNEAASQRLSDPYRSPEVHQLLNGSLRPPVSWPSRRLE